MSHSLEQLKEIFSKHDLNQDGQIDVDEFSSLLKTMKGDDVTQEEIEATFAKIDSDGDKAISLEEFIAAYQS